MVEEKKEDVIAEYYDGVKELEKQGYETAIRKARNTLFVTAALVFIGEMAGASLQGIPITPLLLGIALVEAGVFVGLAFWTKTKPYTAIMTGLILFIALWVFTAVITEGEAIYKGVVVKIISRISF